MVFRVESSQHVRKERNIRSVFRRDCQGVEINRQVNDLVRIDVDVQVLADFSERNNLGVAVDVGDFERRDFRDVFRLVGSRLAFFQDFLLLFDLVDPVRGERRLDPGELLLQGFGLLLFESLLRLEHHETVRRVVEQIFLDQFLEESLGIGQEFANPMNGFTVNTMEDVETAALMLRNVWQLGYDSIVNVLELLESKLFKILLLDTDEKLDGFSGHRGSNPVIVLNKRYAVDRLRFTALHEVGHLLLKIAPHFSEKEHEKICHRFAGALLMPQDVFRKEFGGHRDRLTSKELIEIKEEYGISIAAIISRAKDLGLISEAFYKRFWIKYNQWGWRKEEPGTVAARETSNRFELLLQRAAATEALSLSKCASLAKKTLAEFRREVEFIP